MNFDLYKTRTINSSEAKHILEHIRTSLIEATLPEYRATVEKVAHNVSPPTEPKILGKVLAKILGPFRTQGCGGFITACQVSQKDIEDTLTKELRDFEGLICGIEASTNTVLQQKKQPRDLILSNSAIVYPLLTSRFTNLSSVRKTSKYKTKGILYRYMEDGKPHVWMGHLSSGTSDPEIFPNNRQLFRDVISGNMFNDVGQFDLGNDISFWDVNFDCTDRVNQKLGMPSTLEILLQFTIDHPVQFVIPAVRVRKERIANRPMANNQIHKGGIEQIAESMIATCPRGISVKSLDSDGLFVLSEGVIQELILNEKPRVIETVPSMNWKQYDSFSDHILLDHKPIRVQFGENKYLFRNFMDFKGDIGVIDKSWYCPEKLQKEEDALIAFLIELL
ncbi:MAG: hypothetical protein CMK59_10970 [Proteobacteria bacterium]|nr:hypothetical protein [Pseudomonadota bacterium]